MIYILWIGIGLVLLYEGWSIFNHIPGDTISSMVKNLARKPIVPFAFGVLMGHFFW
jgi:hypothetical protein